MVERLLLKALLHAEPSFAVVPTQSWQSNEDFVDRSKQLPQTSDTCFFQNPKAYQVPSSFWGGRQYKVQQLDTHLEGAISAHCIPLNTPKAPRDSKPLTFCGIFSHPLVHVGGTSCSSDAISLSSVQRTCVRLCITSR